MSAHAIFDTAPLGSLIRYSACQPKPPDRHRKKLSAWSDRNGVGRLVRKEPRRERPTYTSPAGFTLHEGNYGSAGVIAIVVMRSYSVDSELTFEVVERPRLGACRILSDFEDRTDLLHLASSRQDAEVWLTEHHYQSARLEDVTADELAADILEGRAAA